jgi:hypothetical protein
MLKLTIVFNLFSVNKIHGKQQALGRIKGFVTGHNGYRRNEVRELRE